MLLASEEIRKSRQQVLKDRLADQISGEQAGQQLIEIDPDYGPGWLALGSAKCEAGDLDAAEPLMWSALERAPTSPEYYLSLSSVCKLRGDLATFRYLAALGFWKTSFLDEAPQDLGARLVRGAEVDAEAEDPEAVAEKFLAELGDQPWPERLRPYRLLNELQRHAGAGLPAELIDEIRANASACAPLFRAALRESYDMASSSLTMEAECLVVALLGEIGAPGLIEELITLPDTSAEEGIHAHWAVMRVGQRFPAEARAIWLNLPKPDPRLRTAAAQHLYFLRDAGVSRKDVEALLDGFREFAADEEAPYLLLTVSTVLALMGSNADALAVMKRHERQLSKQGRRWILDATGDEDGFLPDLIAIGLDELDIGGVCGELGLMPPDDEDDPGYEDDEYEEEGAPAPKPGRNDPCWCGSGKKYKKCHLDQDEREAREGRAEDDLFRNAFGQLLDFSKRFHGKSDMDRAAKLLLGRRLSEVDEETITESGFILSYLLDFRATSGARTVVEEFLRQDGDRLDDRTRELIESWRDNRYGLWEIQRIEVGRGAEVRDLVSGETYFVDDINTSRECHRWDCMINRVHWHDGKWQFLGDGLLVPRPLLPRIREEVDEGARASGLAPAAYFRSRSHEWRRIVLDAHEEQWKGLRVVNFEGDPIESSFAEYEVGDTDAVASVLAGLPMFEERTEEDDEPGRRVFDWAGEAGKDGGRRLYGHIEIGGGKLRLECNSRRRLEMGRELIEKYCGAYARHLGDTAADPPTKPSKPIDPALERELISKVYAEHYAKWPDEPLPALGGRTPRQAVRSKRGREQVEQLLRDFENGSERDRKEGRPAFDFSRLRSELGL